MKKLLLGLLFLVQFAFADESCHSVIHSDLVEIAKYSFLQEKISDTDFEWIQEKLIMAESMAEGNGFSCLSHESEKKINYTLVLILKDQNDIPAGVLKFLNQLKYNKKFQD